MKGGHPAQTAGLHDVWIYPAANACSPHDKCVCTQGAVEGGPRQSDLDDVSRLLGFLPTLRALCCVKVVAVRRAVAVPLTLLRRPAGASPRTPNLQHLSVACHELSIAGLAAMAPANSAGLTWEQSTTLAEGLGAGGYEDPEVGLEEAAIPSAHLVFDNAAASAWVLLPRLGLHTAPFLRDESLQART